jgi:hypothetical protein
LGFLKQNNFAENFFQIFLHVFSFMLFVGFLYLHAFRLIEGGDEEEVVVACPATWSLQRELAGGWPRLGRLWSSQKYE